MPREIALAPASVLRRCTRFVSALLVFALAWSAQRPEVAQAQGIVALDSAQPPANEFLIHASPDKIQEIATRHGLTILRALDVPPYDVFLVRASNVSTSGAPVSADDVTSDQKITQISSDPTVGHVEVNGAVTSPEVPAGLKLDQSPVWILDALTTPNLVDFGGAQVWDSYLTQPAAGAIHLANSRSIGTGAGVIVAVIDTGVDPNHPLLQRVLLPGYDFIDEVAGGSEWNGVDAALNVLNQSPVWILDGMAPVKLNQSTLAILDPARTSALTGVQVPAAFGHGTMVAGIVHLVAPNARIMPLKAFTANGTSRVFDIVRAIYYAIEHNARVINMSFSTASWSPEITHAINVATDRGIICVASAGNLGQELMVYPAAHRNVLAVGSTNSATPPVRSTFSNFGDSLVSLAAPGESVITTYPGGGYAGGWGTSFSAPMVAGAAALLVQIDPTTTHADAAALLGKAETMALSGLGRGRLNLDALRRATDATKPTVTFLTPASGAISRTVSVSASATDNVAVAGVTFLVDNQPIGGEITSAPYQVSWNTASVTNGSHTLTAVARDPAGNTASATLGVTVSNDVTAPVVVVTSPAQATAVDAVTISATASDDSGIVGVQLKLNGVPLGAEDTEAPYELTWNTATVSNGSHVLTATARDAFGHSTTSAPVTVVVANDFAPPVVSLASPGDAVSGQITLAATATDDVAVAGVQFALDGVSLGPEDTTSPFTVTWDTTAMTNGPHVLTATARDTSGRTTTSADVSVAIGNDLTAPIVSLTNTAGTVSGSFAIAAAASDDRGIAGVQFAVNGVPVGTEDTEAPYEITWDTTTATNGAHVLTAIARDAAGNRTAAPAVNVTVANDAAAPVIALTTAGGSVSGSVTVTATASDDIGVVGVQFKMDGIDVGPERTSAPYEIAWDTASATNGPHVLTAVARDASGRTTTAEAVEMTVSNDTAAPTVALATASGTISGSVTIAATASDDIGVTAVEFLVNGVAIATDTTAPYEIAWDTAAAANGAHTITAVARDAAGHATTAEAVSLSVLNDHVAPTIALLTESGTVSGSVTISASASDDVGVVGVQFFVNGQPFGAEVTAPGYDVTWDTTTASNGTHVLTAVARDASGRTTTAEPLTVTISNN